MCEICVDLYTRRKSK